MINCLVCCGWYDILAGDSRYCHLVVDILDPNPSPTQDEDHALLACSTFRLPIETGAVVLAALVVVAVEVTVRTTTASYNSSLFPAFEVNY